MWYLYVWYTTISAQIIGIIIQYFWHCSFQQFISSQSLILDDRKWITNDTPILTRGHFLALQ